MEACLCGSLPEDFACRDPVSCQRSFTSAAPAGAGQRRLFLIPGRQSVNTPSGQILRFLVVEWNAIGIVAYSKRYRKDALRSFLPPKIAKAQSFRFRHLRFRPHPEEVQVGPAQKRGHTAASDSKSSPQNSSSQQNGKGQEFSPPRQAQKNWFGSARTGFLCSAFSGSVCEDCLPPHLTGSGADQSLARSR